jgi:hypothetical protein
MAYEKIGFNKGDVLKAEHLNHIEKALYDLMPELFFYTGPSWDLEKIIANPSHFVLRTDIDSDVWYYFNRALSTNEKLYFTPIETGYQGSCLVIDKNANNC